ncbi:MAG: hypothetical protein AAF962_18850, partial [Actinomycetota bacterium]
MATLAVALAALLGSSALPAGPAEHLLPGGARPAAAQVETDDTPEADPGSSATPDADDGTGAISTADSGTGSSRRADLVVPLGHGGALARFALEGGGPIGRSSMPSTSGSLPWAADVGPGGWVYVSDAGAGTIERFDATTGAHLDTPIPHPADPTNGGVEPGERFVPRGLVVDPTGDLIVVDAGTDRLRAFRPDGVERTAFDFASDVLIDPVDVAMLADGSLVVSDRGDDDLERFDATTGAHLGPLTAFGPGDRPAGLALDGDGRLLVALAGAGAVVGVDPDTGAVTAPVVTDLARPIGVAVDADGAVWVADTATDLVAAYDPTDGRPTGQRLDLGDGAAPRLLSVLPEATGEVRAEIGGDGGTDRWLDALDRPSDADATEPSTAGEADEEAEPPGDDPDDPAVDPADGPTTEPTGDEPTNEPTGDEPGRPRADEAEDGQADAGAAEAPADSVTFVANEGQADADIDFAALTDDYDAVLLDGDAALVGDGADTADAVVMEVVGGATSTETAVVDPALVDPEAPPTDVLVKGAAGAVRTVPSPEPAAAAAVDRPQAVEFTDVLPGIDVVYSADGDDLEYSFILDPGTAPDDLAVNFDGALALTITPDGDLLIDAVAGPDYLSTAPVSFQDVGDRRVPVESGYVIRPDGTVGFELGAYDLALPVVIDPTFVAVESAAGSYATGSTIDLPVPATVATDDLMIAQVAYNATGGGIIAAPAGWTLLTTASANGVTQSLYWRIATATEPAHYGFTLSSGATDTAAGAITLHDGVDTSSPINAAGSRTNASGAAVSAPSITATTADATLLAFFAVRDDGAATPPSGMNELLDVTSGGGGSAADETLATVAIEELSAAETTGDRTATVDASDGSVGALVALRPATGGSGGATDLVMVTGDGGFSSGTDSAKQSLFQSWGWTVTAIDDGVSASAFTSAAAANDVLFVSDTANGTIAYDVRDLDIGIVNENFSGWSGLLYAGTQDQDWNNDTTVDIVDNSHYITSPFPTGSVTVHTSADDVNYWDGDSSAHPTGVTTLADGPRDTDHYALNVAETGAALYSGNTAVDRRVWFPSDAADPANWTADYQTLLERSLDWAAGNEVAPAVASPTATVNSTGDASDATIGDDICDTGNLNAEGDAECTLRAAIEEANASGAVDTVRFIIPTIDGGHSAGVWTITPTTSNLPALTDAVSIDATTQAGYTDTPVVVLDGSARSGGDDGLWANADSTSISGLSVVNFPDDGVHTSRNSVTFAGLWLGVLPDGTPAANASSDLVVWGTASGTTVDAVVFAAGGSGRGVIVDGTTSGTVIRNSFFGVTPSFVDLNPQAEGLIVNNGAATVTVTDSVFGHLPNAAILPQGGTVTITGNAFGTDPTGTENLPINQAIWSSGSADVLFGGTGAGDGNLIRNSSSNALHLDNAFSGELAVLGNSIAGSNSLGIELGADGITANDADDGDSGPNGLLNYPVITSAAESGGTVIVDYLLDAPAGDYRVEFFTNPSGADLAGNGEGEVFVHAASITHTGSGAEPFSTSFVGVTGDVLTTTATEDRGGGDFGATSEFSASDLVHTPGSVVLDRVQSGGVVLADGSSSVTATIDGVDPAASFLVFSVRGDDSTPSGFSITGALTDSTTLTFDRTGSTGDVTIEWSVAEFASGVSVQRGVATLTSNSTDVAVSAVPTGRSFVLIGHRSNGSTFGTDDFVRANLRSPTNLRFQAYNAPSITAPWQVITYDEAIVQRGTTTLGGGDATRTATVSPVDTTRAWLTYNLATQSGTGADIGQKLVRGTVDDATTLSFDRLNTGQQVDVDWQLIEFTDSTEVQVGNASFGPTDSTVDAAVTPVDPGRTIVSGGANGYGGRTDLATDDNPGHGWFTTVLAAADTLQVRRGATGSTADLAWFAIEWVCPDSDSDGVTDCHEDADTDGDDDPATDPGPDTDADTTPDYLDPDDDGDGNPTSTENADPDNDGNPRDARDTDH